MADDPIADVIIDNLRVAKADFRGYENLRNVVRFTLAEVVSLDLVGLYEIEVAGRRYLFDSTDTTSAHDADRIMVDNTGHRFILVDGDSHGRVTISLSNPSGGNAGDIWIKVIP